MNFLLKDNLTNSIWYYSVVQIPPFHEQEIVHVGSVKSIRLLHIILSVELQGQSSSVRL